LVNQNLVLLDYYAAWSGNYLPTFRDILSVPYSRFKNQRRNPALINQLFCQNQEAVTELRSMHTALAQQYTKDSNRLEL